MDHGSGGFYRNEAISAVQDEDQLYGEDEDYDDLYSDVNVGEGFHQTFHGGDNVRRSGEEKGSEPLPPPVSPLMPRIVQQQQQQLVVETSEKIQIPGIAGEAKIERAVVRSGAFQEQGFTGVDESMVAPRLAAAPPPQPPVPTGRPDIGHPAGGFQQIQSVNDNDSFQIESFQRQGGGFGNEGFQRQGGGVGNVVPVVNANGGDAGGSGGAGGTTLFVGDLHWWTTDAELEAELCKYGQVKEVRFYDERASGKSKGYCQVDFYDPIAATACKEGMNGHIFNGRPCVVALASPFSVRRMGESQMNKNQQVTSTSQPPAPPQKGRGGGGPPVGNNFGRGGGGGGGGGNWGRGGGMGNRGPMNNMRNRMGPMGGRGIMGNGGMVPPPPQALHPGSMLGQGFDPMGYGVAMGRMAAGFGGFPAGAAGAPFPGMMPPFPPVVAPHVNPAFFGRGLAPGGVGMWSNPNMGGWGGEDQSSYGDDAASDQQYGEASHGKDWMAERDRYGGPERRNEKENEMGSGQDWPDRRHRDGKERDSEREKEMSRERDRERERDRDREKERERDRERVREGDREGDRHRDDRDRHGDHYRHRDRGPERDDDWTKARSSRPRSRSREVEHSKRR
ncbi:cleavage and polyadenylation specificity factor subunit 6-like [Zingiber officinale]|uniref:cleavage and polyadenylation specificity factor subunit 6-like n=1 Tax=Zingiber officinale TaxID=94328 RepID=UPI001C4C4DF3|nr:cleavage and polyadenylation specificity factor subunit 6-like [Zingiber officinale]XP_042437386.1 cleavage and polyadenylation specificity factor subunit 6-like [Zingiber officinale]XP_042437392.1 cleavage and polyadenylation specificity factor subunit 6-like [Zingiber officinale]XP_042437400.1 cleavage and polyadenylation specificity factor subunit 6-like [Zingiber officinale]